MTTCSSRRFLRIPIAALSAMLPVATLAQGYPSEPAQPGITTDSLNKRILALENERIFTTISINWLQWNVKAMLKCFRGCGMIPKQRYRA